MERFALKRMEHVNLCYTGQYRVMEVNSQQSVQAVILLVCFTERAFSIYKQNQPPNATSSAIIQEKPAIRPSVARNA
jgi:hypothetical protein